MNTNRRASLHRRRVYAAARKVSPGRIAFGASLGWHFGELLVGLARLAVVAAIIATLAYCARHL